MNYTHFNHLDFLWARDVKVLVNDKIEKLISSKNNFKDVLSNSVHDVVITASPTVSRSFSFLSSLSIFQTDFNEIKLKAKSAADLSKIERTLKEQWKSIQKRLPSWQNSISSKLGSLQGYIQNKLLKKERK